ncbi:hypothetical protein [Corynebacterium hindlerae]|uniref:hypothetical protein n=1 Tax=Corynebacterium hindlerae TaxID=699041 RepID=UPI0031B6DFA4
MTTPEQAREQLQLANSLSSRASSFNPVWITYVALCTAGTIYVMGRHWAPDSLIPTILSVTWTVVFCSMLGVFAIVQPATRRGFGKRWGVMMALWAITWVLATVLHASLDTAMFLSTIFLLLAVAGTTWEAIVNRAVR